MTEAPLAVSINGEVCDRIPFTDRGLQYGDGVFETLAAANGETLLWERHYARLARGCARLQIACPPTALLAAEVAALARGHARAVIKIIVTRGSGARGYRPTSSAPTRIVSAWPWPRYPAAHWRGGIRLFRCRTTLAIQQLLADIKHLNRLEQVLARAEWGDAYAEGLVADTEGRVIAGTMSNLFAIDGHGGIVTPVLGRCGVLGIMRGCVLETAAALGISTAEAALNWDSITNAAGLFVTNSVIGLWPVAEFNGRRYPIHETYQTLQAEIVRRRFALAADA